MKRPWTRAFLTFVIVAIVGVGAASAQTPVAEIPFKFFAGSKAMPAGTYEIQASQAGPIRMTGVGINEMVTLPVITYLGRHDADAEIELIFDKIDGQMYLSEVWFPGKDGLLLLGTKERHDHQVLRGPKKK